MRKHVFGRQFKRDTNERKALFKGLINELILRESITTTEEKAKAIKGQAEKLVTKAKKRQSEAKQFLQPYLSPVAIEKMMKDLSVRFADRSGGYTRVIKLGKRMSDNASLAIIEWVEKGVKVEVVAPEGKKKEKTSKKAEVIEAELTAKPENKKEEKKTTKKGEKTSGKQKKETNKK